MRKILPAVFIFILSFISFQSLTAQLAIIKDPDGFCNIRKDANNQSAIEDTIANGRLVFAFEEGSKGNWLLVDYNKGKETLPGYIHKSRVVFLKDMTAFNEIVVNDTLLKLQLNEMQITIKAGSFVKAGRKLTYDKQSGAMTSVSLIDGKRPWGTDWNMPRNEYRSIQFRSGTKTLNFPKSSFTDLFEPNLDLTSAFLDKTTGKIYLKAANSDAAGAYLVIWILNNGKIEHRETFIPF